MAKTPAWLSISDATEELLNRQRQATGTSLVAAAPAGFDPYGEPSSSDSVLAGNLASPDQSGPLLDISWKSRQNRRDHERNTGNAWPRTDGGRNFDQHHIVPKSEGGADSWENIRPMHPLEHRQHHMQNGDFSRWARLRGKGKVPPKAGALGWLGLIPDIAGVLSGRIRTDTFDNFTSDLMGVPSQEDRQRALEEEQRAINPNWKPGDPIVA